MSDTAIELHGVKKRFGATSVLDGVDLVVPTGKTYAFLGVNGAGKTTTIRMLMGLLKPDGGTIRVLGMDPAKEALTIRREVGYLAEDQQMWGWMRVQEILQFVAAFYPTWDWKLARQLMETFGLPTKTHVKHLSKGQNVRLGLLLALAHRPRLMILDDPALGLDPIMRKEFLRDVVTHLQGNEVTVFFSSHLLYEVEPVADLVGILDKGRIVCAAGTEELRARVRQLVLARAAWEEVGAQVEGVLDVRPDGERVAVVVADAAAARSVLRGVAVKETELNLDEIFEAYVAGRKEVGHGPRADVERVA